jgi:vancomycin resistance protein YoaR
MIFNLDEVNKRTEDSEELLAGVRKKMLELKTEFDELQDELDAHDDEYFKKNSDVRKKLSERIRKRLSMYELLKEVAETLRDKTRKDMQLVLEELQKKKYYK